MFPPLLYALLALLAGMLWCPFASLDAARPIMLVVGAAWLITWLACLILAQRYQSFEHALHGVMILGALALGMLLGSPRLPATSHPARATAYVEAALLEPAEWRVSQFGEYGTQTFSATFLAQTARIHWRGFARTTLTERIRCTLVSAQPIPLQRGDVFAVTGVWSRLPRATNPGQFDMAAYFARQGVAYRFIARRGALRWCTPPLSPRLRAWRALDRLRAAARSALAGPPALRNEAIVLRGMVLGVREGIPEDIAETLQRTSTLHIIAISGLHIGILCGLWWAVVWLIGVPGRWRGVLILPVVWLYALMVGLRSSVVRATLMFTGLALAPLAARPHRAIHTLAVVAFFYLLFWPEQAGAPGTLLSFLSVAALVAFLPVTDAALARARWFQPLPSYDREHPIRRVLNSIFRYLLQLSIATLAIWAVTWPLTLTRSNLITPSAWLANLLVIPVISAVLAGGFAALLLACVWPLASSTVLFLTLWLLRGLLWFVELLGALPGGFFAFPSLTPLAMLCYYASVACIWYWLFLYGTATLRTPLRRRLVGAGALLAALLFFNCVDSRGRHHGSFTVTALDVGLGDAFVMRSPEGHTLLLDAGTRFGQSSMGTRVVVPYLRAMGINRIDAVILSHFDRDHAGGLPEVLESMRVRAIYAPPISPGDIFAQELRTLASARAVRWITATAGLRHHWGSLRADVLGPPRRLFDLAREDLPWDDNAWSLVVRFQCRGASVLMTGDATVASEALLLQRPQHLRSHVLKVAHHGSLSSTSPRFLDAVQPYLALLSVGQNQLGLPADDVLALLRGLAVPLVRTDLHGALRLVMRQHEIAVEHFVVNN